VQGACLEVLWFECKHTGGFKARSSAVILQCGGFPGLPVGVYGWVRACGVPGSSRTATKRAVTTAFPPPLLPEAAAACAIQAACWGAFSTRQKPNVSLQTFNRGEKMT